ncbi:hypothetical protein GGH19_003709 [Coemansia sp. RSA 1807]|nr:hypothetical protein LPJ58_004397 [Coemansia sp. RSA 1591]KAJ1757650.1 hypothetical protein LPJ69_004336 [Coemansia sp. RSA 1752]KAJ2132371.1 hypothetical protein GGF48_000978 [Coemansia sp. RSA 921]KAJ2281259.1 hypothetical protein EV176_000564 [Coemansia sp. RSA 451]KAJ2533407.1 hypothetical protein GGH20_000660 [Coemansia sp. RSA 1937]KAJ2574562.1 hypothetical protein GGH19_003709 [Coemansia sp. RSA 1807]
MPLSYIVIFERASPENIIFASSNCEQVLGYTPHEMVGTSAMTYSADSHAKHYSCEWPADNPELGVTMMPHNLRRKDGSSVYTHSIAINCSGYLFTVVNAFPELGHVDLGESVLYKLQHETDFVQLDAEKASSEQLGCSDPVDLVSPALPVVTTESLRKAHVFTARASRIKACVIVDHSDDVNGPVIEFVTNTIGNMYSGDVDAHELIGRSFFSLLVASDVSRAATYLDSLIQNTRPQMCVLRLVRQPLDEPTDERGESIEIEVFGASSGTKIMLLCQRVRRNRKLVASANRRAGFDNDDDDLPYMSLEDIISSDPESSDLNNQWYKVPL